MKNRVDKFIVALALVLLLLLMLPVNAHGQTVVDPSRQGSLTLRLKDLTSEHAIPGAEIYLYTLATLEGEPGVPTYLWSELYRDLAEEGGELSSATFAEQLARRALDQAEPLYRTRTGAEGEAVFTDLALGLYLLVQTAGPETHYPMEAFLVSLPLTNEAGSAWLYDVTAYPKVEARPETTVPSEPDFPSEPAPTVPTQPGDPDGCLIITGSSYWLILLLSAGGLSLIILGWILRRKEQADVS